MLDHSQKHKDLAATLRSALSAELPRPTGKLLADSVYALVVSGLDTGDSVQKMLGANKSGDMVALGFYFAGNYESSGWQHEQAYAFWDKGLSFATQKELKEAITKVVADSERLWERKNKIANQAPENTARKLTDPQR